ncbi:MAG: 50S ribosomal protein L18 [Bacteroidetes bacterium]|nr:50S ribosomal protein L18 [Bacteroidota bacterium]
MLLKKVQNRLRNRYLIRKKIFGAAERPRLAVYRSNKAIYAQLIDDNNGHTLVAASSREKSLGNEKSNKTELAKKVGQLIAKKATAAGISIVVFDRGGFLYHGRIKALAEGAREGGLKF